MSARKTQDFLFEKKKRECRKSEERRKERSRGNEKKKVDKA